MARKRRTHGLVALFILAALGVGVAVTHDVSRAVSPADSATARTLLASRAGVPAEAAGFAHEVAIAVAVQDAVLAAAPLNEGIPEGTSRELTDLVRAGKGLCFDRSRAIETILRSRGFEVRHASIYSTAETGSAIKSLATPRTESHAITEMKTRRGWMAIDSNNRWIGLTASGEPVDLAEISATPQRMWHPAVIEPLPPIYRKPFTWVYGLYSRHGRFYPPYNAVPDVSWPELVQNL